MPADKYGKSLYKAGTMKSEKAAIANRDPARKAAAMKIMAREGTTSAAGGRPAAKTAMPKAPQVIRTTVMFKPTPTKKK
jgi:hypothetical protein